MRFSFAAGEHRFDEIRADDMRTLTLSAAPALTLLSSRRPPWPRCVPDCGAGGNIASPTAEDPLVSTRGRIRSCVKSYDARWWRQAC